MGLLLRALSGFGRRFLVSLRRAEFGGRRYVLLRLVELVGAAVLYLGRLLGGGCLLGHIKLVGRCLGLESLGRVAGRRRRDGDRAVEDGFLVGWDHRAGGGGTDTLDVDFGFALELEGRLGMLGRSNRLLKPLQILRSIVK